MKLVQCSIFDTVAGVYSRPFSARSKGEAQRMFLRMCEEDESVSKSPSDFRLYAFGEFDEVTGVLDGWERPEQLMVGSQRELRAV